MEMTFAKCETVLNTLPIGYYAGRRIECILDNEAKTSFYSPMEDKIVVSYPIIANRMKQMVNTANEEQAVRSMLYHEVSHAIMTNTDVLFPRPCENIFEDERIETVLKDYYLDTDFKKQLLEIHGNKIPKATNQDTAFYNAVRFRHAPADILKDVENIIRTYGNLLRKGKEDKWYDYRRAIYNLYEKVGKEFTRNRSAFQPKDGEEQEGNAQQTLDNIKQSASGDSQNGKKQAGQGQQDGNEGEEEREGNGEKTYSAEVKDNLSKEMREKMQKAFGGGLSPQPQLGKEEATALNDFTKTAEMIIGNFNKKNNGGCGINAYSGIFNPRAVSRPDYRYFERSMTTQGNNKFGTCHLNLFIDCSGSMSDNEDIVNGMLASLTAIERKNRNFTMDVVFIDHGYHECQTIRERNFKATGSNDIPQDMKEKFLAHQKPNTCNYNIVLFDGDVYCMANRGRAEEIRRFSAFDYKQTTVIIDPSNKPYLGSGFKNAKVILTRDYAKELLNHVTKALTIAFG